MAGIRVRGEEGFSLLEVIVVALVLGVLAAIALPAFLSQQDKGKDATAKSDARNLAMAVLSCRHEADSYGECDQESELSSHSQGYEWGTSPGQSSVVSAEVKSFSVEAVSEGSTDGANNKFTLSRAADGSISRSCTGSDLCAGGSW